MQTIDLHTHSSSSDGSMTPSELIYHAKDLGLSAIALTDHDTTTGIDEAASAARDIGLEFIPGIELSARYIDREVHIVGLYIDHHNSDFLEQISEVANDRFNRNANIVKLMQASGIDITEESLEAEEGSGILTRANFANYLKNHGYVKSVKEAFDRYLDHGKPFYIPRKYLTPESAIQAIKRAHGIPILAHPLLYHFNDSNLDRCVSYLKEAGIEGIEVYYSRNVGGETLKVKHLADKYNLLYSGGSDYHGSYKPDIELGRGTGKLCIPYDVLENIKKSRKPI